MDISIVAIPWDDSQEQAMIKEFKENGLEQNMHHCRIDNYYYIFELCADIELWEHHWSMFSIETIKEIKSTFDKNIPKMIEDAKKLKQYIEIGLKYNAEFTKVHVVICNNKEKQQMFKKELEENGFIVDLEERKERYLMNEKQLELYNLNTYLDGKELRYWLNEIAIHIKENPSGTLQSFATNFDKRIQKLENNARKIVKYLNICIKYNAYMRIS